MVVRDIYKAYNYQEYNNSLRTSHTLGSFYFSYRVAASCSWLGSSHLKYIERVIKVKIIYLAAYKAKHNDYDITYQDINGLRDIGGDMLDIELNDYDIIIATPPCNYWSKANYRRNTSDYAKKTKHLLPAIIDKCIKINKPFIIENVRNRPLFNEYGLFDKKCFIYEHGRHTYWTNIPFNPTTIKQQYDFKYGGIQITKNRQGGKNVHDVINYWLNTIIERSE